MRILTNFICSGSWGWRRRCRTFHRTVHRPTLGLLSRPGTIMGKPVPTRKPARKNAKAKPKAQGPARPAVLESFPVVGVGASAGGLEAFSELLRHLPEKIGMAFVLVQHLDPSHGSMLQEILSRTTRMPVREVTEGMVVEPDHIYVMPANTQLEIKGNVLHLGARSLERGMHMPINSFFASLAAERAHRAIGVILSGTA